LKPLQLLNQMTDSHETYAYICYWRTTRRHILQLFQSPISTRWTDELLRRVDKRGHTVMYSNNAWKKTKLLLMQNI